MVEKIAELLKNNFPYVYCNTCRFQDEFYNPCEDCYRKNMNWALSSETAESIATDIVNLLITEINSWSEEQNG